MGPGGANTLARILEAGIEAFAHDGPSAAATLQIAQKAGVAESTIFRRFDNKENFFRECFRTTISRSLDPGQFRALMRPEAAHGVCEFAALVQGAVKRWYLSMPVSAARLVLFVSLSGSRRWRCPDAQRINQVTAILAERIAQEGRRRRTQRPDARAAALNLITNLLYLKSTRSNGRSEMAADTCIRQWMFGLFPV